MKTVATVGNIQSIADELRRDAKRIAVVPTLGYLHGGHLNLIRLAKQHADVVIATVFVNPTQFAPTEDFSRYPRDLERDIHLLESAGTDYLFAPSTEEMYPPGFQTYIEAEHLSRVLEGKSRPTHFKGVTTIVLKLFHATKPHVAIFGQKDAQQAVIIRQMVNDLNLDIEILVAPIVRETDGLAMSSRNVYLSGAERAQSVVLWQSLAHAKAMIERGERNASAILVEVTAIISSKPLARIDYVSIADAATLEELSAIRSGTHVLISLAVRFGTTRLIDNVVITV